MISFGRFVYVFIPIFFSLATITLSACAISGSTSNKSKVNQIYLIRLNLTEVNLSTVISSSSVSTSVSASSLGLSDLYSFGLWSYCKGSNDDGDYDVSYCSSPKAMYAFNALEVLESDLNNESLEISLPSDVEKYIKTGKTIFKVIYVTALAGIVLSVITAFFTVISFCSHGISCLSTIVGILAFLSLGVSAGGATGSFLLVKRYFNDSFDDYGISADLANYQYYALIWCACGCSLLAAIFNLFGSFCGRTHSNYQVPQVQPILLDNFNGNNNFNNAMPGNYRKVL